MNTTSTTEAETPEFSITRTFDAPRDLVWKAWTDEAEMGQWLHPFGVATDGVAIDLTVGGRYRYTMTNIETGEEFPTGGEYLEIEPQTRLVFTWGDPDAPVADAPVITLIFTQHGEQTELVFHLRGIDGKPGDGWVYDGWDEALTNFGKHLTGETLG